MDLQLSGKVAIVTGASRGIGRAIVEVLAAEGMRLALAARSRDQLEALAASLGSDCLIQAIDLREPDAPASLVAAEPQEDEQRRALVTQALDAMAPADREVLQLTLVDGLHPREIAQRLSLPPETVRQRKTRALKRLVAVVVDGPRG